MNKSLLKLENFANNIIFTNSSDCYHEIIRTLEHFSIRKNSGEFVGKLGLPRSSTRSYPSILGIPKKSSFKFDIKKIEDFIITPSHSEDFNIICCLCEDSQTYHFNINSQNIFDSLFSSQPKIFKKILYSQFNLIKRLFYDWVNF